MKIKNLIILLILLSPASIGIAQVTEVGKAITTEGRRIILFSDGTWKYELEPVPVTRGTIIADTVESLYNKPIGGQFQKSPYNKKEWVSNRTNFSVWFDPKKWKMDLRHAPPGIEVRFHFIENICDILTENFDIDLETWVYRGKLLWKENYPSLKIQQEEWRTVNGLNVYYIKWQTGDNRSNVQCHTYYAKGNKELIQMHVYSSISAAYQADEEIFRLLNGMVLNK
jgi:hypothetical protein